MFITALVTTTCGVALFGDFVVFIRDSGVGWELIIAFLLLKIWLRHGGLSEPIDPSQPTPEPEESESVDGCPEDDVPDDPELELFWEPSFEPLSELCVIEETPLVLPLLQPYDTLEAMAFLQIWMLWNSN